VSSRKFRSILAVATLTVGVSWMTADPAAAGVCPNESASVRSPASVGHICDDTADVLFDPSRSGTMVETATDRLYMAALQVADRLGMAGMVSGQALMNVADQAGMAATSGLPALPSGVPGPAGLRDVSRVAEAPDTPLLSPLTGGGKPSESSIKTTLPTGGSLLGTGADSPNKLLGPVDEIKRETVRSVLPEVPKALEDVHDAVPLPASNPAIDSFNALIQGMHLD
jgi:hypothetical protein